MPLNPFRFFKRSRRVAPAQVHWTGFAAPKYADHELYFNTKRDQDMRGWQAGTFHPTRPNKARLSKDTMSKLQIGSAAPNTARVTYMHEDRHDHDLHGRYKFILDKYHNLYIFLYEFHENELGFTEEVGTADNLRNNAGNVLENHSDAAPAYKVAYAGMMDIYHNQLTRITNESGHFRPRKEDFGRMRQACKEMGISLKHVTVDMCYG